MIHVHTLRLVDSTKVLYSTKIFFRVRKLERKYFERPEVLLVIRSEHILLQDHKSVIEV